MRRALRIIATIAVVAAIAIVALRLLFPLPDISDRAYDGAPAPDPEARLVQLTSARAAQSPDLSGVIPLLGGKAALASRLELIRL